MTDNNNPEQIDPIRDATEAMLYSDVDTASEKLRAAIHAEAAKLSQHQARTGRLQAEHTRSMESLQKFNEQNDAYRDPLVQGAGKVQMVEEQYKDLIDAGFLDVEQFQRQMGRKPTEQDVFNLHLEARAVGVKGMRSTDQLLDAVASKIEEKFGVRRRVTGVEENRKRGIADRMKVSAHSHGVDLDEYELRAPEPPA